MNQPTPRFVIGKEARLTYIVGSGISSAKDGQAMDGRGRAINYPSPKVAVGFLSNLDPSATKVTPCRAGKPRRTERSMVAAPLKITAAPVGTALGPSLHASAAPVNLSSLSGGVPIIPCALTTPPDSLQSIQSHIEGK